MTRPEAEDDGDEDGGAAPLRLDKWLWHARFFKTRGLATRVVAAGKVRLNGRRVKKPAAAVAPGDVLTFVAGARVRVIRVRAAALRRGPAAQARTLYDDLSENGNPASDPSSPPLD